jgi:hypothetical protein
MEMCPYCGEDVPDDSKSCWKCGTELSGDGEPGGGDGGEPTIEQRRRQPERAEIECPFCEATVPAKALRCNECGRQVRKHHAARNWIPAVYTAFGIVLLSILVGFGWAALSGGPAAPDPGRDSPIGFDYAKLEKIYLDSRDTEKLRELWKERHQGKFVEWEMHILQIDEDGTLLLASSPSASVPEVRLELKPPAQAQIEEHELSEGKMVRFSAALRDFDDETFGLDLGLVLDE